MKRDSRDGHFECFFIVFDENLEIGVGTDASAIQAGGIITCFNPETKEKESVIL